jgi:hypothetical protein
MKDRDDVAKDVLSRIEQQFVHPTAGEGQLLPVSDPHVSTFLESTKTEQGSVGYCLAPLVEMVARHLGEDLSFLVLMFSPRARLAASSASHFHFSALHNCGTSIEERDHFRSVFRFVGRDIYGSTSLQTSQILHEGQEARLGKEWIYGMKGPASPVPSQTNILSIPAERLIEAIRDSRDFQALQASLRTAHAIDCNSILSKSFKRFFEDGSLEEEILAGDRSESLKFAQDRKVELVFESGAGKAADRNWKEFSVALPVLFSLWHSVLNACGAAAKCKEDRRRVRVTAECGEDGVRFKVKNCALEKDVLSLSDSGGWRGLEYDADILRALWMDEAASRGSEP